MLLPHIAMVVMPTCQISTSGEIDFSTLFLLRIYRGSQVRFCILPDMLKNAPMLTYDKKSKQPRGLGRGAYRGRGRGRGMPGGRGGPPMGGGYGGGPNHRGRPSARAFHGTPGFMRNSERARYGDGGRGGGGGGRRY